MEEQRRASEIIRNWFTQTNKTTTKQFKRQRKKNKNEHIGLKNLQKKHRKFQKRETRAKTHQKGHDGHAQPQEQGTGLKS